MGKYNLTSTMGVQEGIDYLNGSLEEMAGNFHGTTEPENPVPHQWWPDETMGLLKQRNAANTAWIIRGTLSQNYSGLVKPGLKVGMDIYYYGADDLRIHPGQVHVHDGANDFLVKKDTEFLLSSLVDLSILAGWYYVCVAADGTISLETATGAATERPTDAFFQWAGYDHVKQGYYSTTRRIIGAIRRVDTDTWYTINCGEGGAEVGKNQNGSWTIDSLGNILQRGEKTASASADSSFSVLVSMPMNFCSTSDMITISAVPKSYLALGWHVISYAVNSVNQITIGFGETTRTAQTGSFDFTWAVEGRR